MNRYLQWVYPGEVPDYDKPTVLVFHTQFCKTHVSTFDPTMSNKNCVWDLLAGPRPGRGACAPTFVQIIDNND